MSELIFGWFSGDLGALSVLFVLMLPFVLVYAGIKSIIQSTRRK
jgi:hypothetical protein